jgi:Leucine-rich repeat (LRR) protein
MVHLDVDGNDLTELPGCLGSSPLAVLTASSNRLTQLPSNFSSLLTLDLFGNQFDAFPAQVAGMPGLLSVYLGRNQIAEVPDFLGNVTLLKVLDLSENALTVVSPAISRLRNLDQLDLSSNRLKTLPDLGPLTRLRGLLLRSNLLERVPEGLGALTSLTTLDLGANRISSAGVEVIGRLPLLEELSLHDNALTRLPAALSGLVLLERLHLDSNPFDPEAPLPDLSSLVALTELSLSNTPLTRLPALPAANSSSLVRLDVNANRLEGALDLCAKSLETLNVNGNAGVTAVGDGGDCFPSLTSFDAARCNLTSIAFVAAAAGGLSSLDISGNELVGDGLPELLRSRAFVKLKTLLASASGLLASIAEVIAAVACAPALLSLDVSWNQIFGALDRKALQAAGIDIRSGPPMNLIQLRLDGTLVSFFQSGVEPFLPSLLLLSCRNMTNFSPEVPVVQQKWLNLEELDVRGSKPDPRVVPPVGGSSANVVVDLTKNCTCPSSLPGGSVAKFSVIADPEYFSWSGCSCLDGFYGEPALGCLVCPAVPPGAEGVAVDCQSLPGSLVVTGGWLTFDRATSRMVVLPCPADTADSPCATNRLGITVRTYDDWEARVAKANPRLNITTCVEGHQGRLCSKCKPGFFRSGRSCHRCGGKGLSWLNPLASLLVMTGLGVHSVAGGYSSRSGLIRTLTMHAQLVALLPDMSLRLTTWSSFLIKASGSGAGGLSLNGLECEGKGWDGFYGPFVQAGLLPVIVAIGSAWIGLVSGYVGGGRSKTASRPPRSTCGWCCCSGRCSGCLPRSTAPTLAPRARECFSRPPCGSPATELGSISCSPPASFSVFCTLSAPSPSWCIG